MIYTYIKSAFSNAQTYKLEDNMIKVYNETNMLIDTISFSETKSISLVYTPTKVTKNMHQCTIKTSTNKKIIICNYSYKEMVILKIKLVIIY